MRFLRVLVTSAIMLSVVPGTAPATTLQEIPLPDGMPLPASVNDPAEVRINNQRKVAATAYYEPAAGGSIRRRAYIFDVGTSATLLIPPPSGVDEAAANMTSRAINNAGQVVGFLDNADFEFDGILTGTITLTGGITSIRPLDISDEGTIVGEASVPAAPSPGIGFIYRHGALTGLTDLFGNPNFRGWLESISDNGQIAAGLVSLSGGTRHHAIRYSGTGFADLHPAGPNDPGDSWAHGVNDAGIVVGEVGIRAYRWHGEDSGELLCSPSSTRSYAYAINNSGDIVGSCGGRATIWRNGIPTDLNTLKPAGVSFPVLTFAVGINERGDIVGYTSGSPRRNFLLTLDDTSSACGNAVVEGDEGCDDGNTDSNPIDGCSSTCTEEPGWDCTNLPGQASECTPLVACGNGLPEGEEECDEGEQNSEVGCCSQTCTDRCRQPLPCGDRGTKSGILPFISRHSVGKESDSPEPELLGLSSSPSVSDDGRMIAFLNETQLYLEAYHPHEGAVGREAMLKDRRTGVLIPINAPLPGARPFVDGETTEITVSADGRCVAYTVASLDEPEDRHIWLAREWSESPLASPPERFQAFRGQSPSLSANCGALAYETTERHDERDTDDLPDVYVVDLEDFADGYGFGEGHQLASITQSGEKTSAGGRSPVISKTGRYVAFVSEGDDIDVSANGVAARGGDVFVTDLDNQEVIRISKSPLGQDPNASLRDGELAFGGDRYVAFSSYASNLSTRKDDYVGSDVFVHDLVTGVTSIVSVAHDGSKASGSSFAPSISADGRRVSFLSLDHDLDTETSSESSVAVYVRDLRDRTTTLMSTDSSGRPATHVALERPALSGDGGYVTFVSDDASLVRDDANLQNDVFGRHTDRGECYEYLALGDSYSSGEGTTDYDNGTNNKEFNGDKCRRSHFAYSRLGVGGWNGIRDEDILHVACSGAESVHVLEDGQYDEDAQLAWVRKSGGTAKLVTITIGGNDCAFGDVVAGCLQENCPDWKAQKAVMAPVRYKLKSLYEKIREAAPDARIVVSGYPNVVSNKDLCAIHLCEFIPPANECLDVGVTKEVVSYAKRLTNHLNQNIIAGAVREASAFLKKRGMKKIEYLNSTQIFGGHGVCSDDEWVNFITLSFHDSFHPNSAGHEAWNAHLVDYLNRTTR